MKMEDIRHVAGFIGIMIAGIGSLYLFVWMMSLAAALDK